MRLHQTLRLLVLAWLGFALLQAFPTMAQVQYVIFEPDIKCKTAVVVIGEHPAIEDAIDTVNNLTPDINLKTRYPERIILIGGNDLPAGVAGFSSADTERIVIDNDELKRYRATYEIAVHELGHSLGLPHNDRETSIMNPVLRDSTTLDEQDIADFNNIGCE